MSINAQLQLHPSAPSTLDVHLAARLSRLPGGLLEFAYTLSGSLSDLKLPQATARPERRDGLWLTTCFEAFLQPFRQSRYLEINFSPSLDWAAYRFESYRRPMSAAARDAGQDERPAMPALATRAPDVRAGWSKVGEEFTLSARVAEHELAQELQIGRRSQLSVGLTAVVETTDGKKTYWALAHPRPAPDFHDAAGFTVILDIAATADR